MKRNDSCNMDRTQALAMLKHGIARLDTFTYPQAAFEPFMLWRAQMQDALILLLGENALAVFEWRVLRFAPAIAHDNAHARQVWTTSRNYARVLLNSVLQKCQQL